jgi:hypothetical protein
MTMTMRSGAIISADDAGMTRSDPPLDAVCARLRGEPVVIGPEMIACARANGVHLVLAESLSAAEARNHPELRADLLAAAALDAVRDRVAADAIAALCSAGVRVLTMKGAGVAHRWYSHAFARPRHDLDLLVDAPDIARAHLALVAAGWRPEAETPAMEASAQRHYQRPIGPLAEQLDLHWRVSNVRVFADVVSFAELDARAVAVPALGPSARTLSLPDALWLACAHRVAHHADAVYLLWLWDIHRLVSALARDDAAEWIALVERTRTRAVCARGLERAGRCFGTPVAPLIAALRAPHAAEPSAQFLDARSMAAIVASDLRAARGWRLRGRVMREHLFPPRAYLRARYPRWPFSLLPLAYAYRIVRGAPAWLRR